MGRGEALDRGHISLSRSKSETRNNMWKKEEFMLTFCIASLVHGLMHKGRKGQEEVQSRSHGGQKRLFGGGVKKISRSENGTGLFLSPFLHLEAMTLPCSSTRANPPIWV